MILVFTMLYFWCVKITKGTVQRNGTMEQHCEGRTTDVIREGGCKFWLCQQKRGRGVQTHDFKFKHHSIESLTNCNILPQKEIPHPMRPKIDLGGLVKPVWAKSEFKMPLFASLIQAWPIQRSSGPTKKLWVIFKP